MNVDLKLRYIGLCLCVLCSLQAGANEPGHLIVAYDFDDALQEVGPDTYQIFKHQRGKVGLSQAYKFSGWRSLKIQDIARDGGFPELQGYFKAIASGRLYFHFAFMVAEVEERFNIALAGESHFQLAKHGIGFWLDNKGGYLRHWTNSMPQRLFQLQPFVWYQVDLDYDIDAGRYDLTIVDEYGQQLVKLSDQPNTVDQEGSTVDKFSFIGDLADRENASYYVDDVMLYSQQAFSQPDFVAPGRRKLFVDIWDDYHRKLYGKIQCLPGVQSMDFGIDIDTFTALAASGHYDTLNRLLENQAVEPGNWQDVNYLQAIQLWQQGCANMKQQQWQRAISDFSEAGELVGSARLYPLSLALAYAGAGDYEQADSLLAMIQSEWVNEPRLSVAYAMIGISRDDLFTAKQWLTESALTAYQDGGLEVFKGLYCDFITNNMISRLKNYDPENWPQLLERAVITEQYYFALLWEQNYHDAFYYARDMMTRLQALGFESAKWQERAADAAFYSKDYELAIEHYQSSLNIEGGCNCAHLKLADIYHIKGDSAKEREYREKIYGRFEEIY